jgi:hypothetical protein
MFPALWNEFQKLIPRAYFGGVEVPQYYRRIFSCPPATEDLVREIRHIGCGGTSAGYIDSDGIHFHLHPEAELGVDLSREFIFISTPDITAAVLPGSWQMLRFLQEPVRQALYLDSRSAVLIRKTAKTMELCEGLDEIWQRVTLCKALPGALKHVRGRARLLPLLMRTYERQTTGDPTVMWDFYPTFGRLLAEERLFLEVQEIG